jgi:hypothetical protein
VTSRTSGASSEDAVEGTTNLKEVGPTDRPDSQEVARNSAGDPLHGRMNFCREAEGTGDPGKSSDRERNPRRNVPDVEEGTTRVTNNTP